MALIVSSTAETVASVGLAVPDVTFALTVFAGMVFARKLLPIEADPIVNAAAPDVTGPSPPFTRTGVVADMLVMLGAGYLALSKSTNCVAVARLLVPLVPPG